MRYQLIFVGSLKKPFYQEACQAFLDRLQGFAKVEIVEVKGVKAPDSIRVRERESEAILRVAKGFKIGLDETGGRFDSRTFANHISQFESQGIGTLSFLMGGAEGHSDRLKEEVNALWSLSSLTMSHDLARLVLLEQLYRAETIRAGHPYHKD